MTLTGIVVAGTLRALTAQKKFYARQARILDARHAMRASETILASELRAASSPGGDLYAIASDSFALRSTVGFGVACAVNVGAYTLSLTEVSGHVRLEAGDSVLVFVENGQGNSDDLWRAMNVASISMVETPCAWGGSAERHVTVSGNLLGVWVGAPVRLFRPYVYRLFELEGRWWLGRRNLAGGSELVPVAGPLAPPEEMGLALTYYDYQTHATTLDPLRVGLVEIRVRAPTYRSLIDPDYHALTTSVFLRNN
jgi:hypothetical protein